MIYTSIAMALAPVVSSWRLRTPKVEARAQGLYASKPLGSMPRLTAAACTRAYSSGLMWSARVVPSE